MSLKLVKRKMVIKMNKKGYFYQVELKENNSEQQASFEIYSHDDIFEKLAIIDQKLSISTEDKQAFLIGMKMAGEIILKHKDHPLFSQLKAPMREIMMTLKSSVK